MAMTEILVSEIHELKHKHRFHGFYVVADSGVPFPIVAETSAGVIVEGERTGALGRVVQTGHKVSRDGLVRCRIEFAHDLEDAEGTLDFSGERIGGEVNYRVFEETQEGQW